MMPADGKLLDWASLRRQILTGDSPYLGVPQPGRPALAFKRDFLRNTAADLRYAFAWIEPTSTHTLLGDKGKYERTEGAPCLRVVSACGTRRYRYWDQQTVERSGILGVLKAHQAFRLRKRAALLRGAWIRRTRWESTVDGDGRVVTSWYRDGLMIRENIVYHRGSGKSAIIAGSEAEAFALAEQMFKLWDGWQEPNADKLLAAIPAEIKRKLTLNELRRVA